MPVRARSLGRAVFAFHLLDFTARTDQTPQAIGSLHEPEGRQDRLSDRTELPAAGRDMLGGVASTFKGKILGRELTKWPRSTRFFRRACESKGRKSRISQSLFFYPGKAGVQFLSQYSTAIRPEGGRSRSIRRSRSTSSRCRYRKTSRWACPGARRMGERPAEMKPTKCFVADYLKKYPGLRPSFLRCADLRSRRIQGRIGSRPRPTATCPTTGSRAKALEKPTSSRCAEDSLQHQPYPRSKFLLRETVKDSDGNFVLKTDRNDRWKITRIVSSLSVLRSKSLADIGGGGAMAPPPFRIIGGIAVGAP